MFRQVKQAFDFQIRDVARIIQALFHQGHNCVVYRLPTGGGKTVISGEVAEQAILNYGCKVLFITHRDSILKQTFKLFSDAGHDTGKIVAGGAWQRHKTLNIGMDKSFTARMTGYEDCLPELLIIDEAHHVKGGNKPTGMGRIAAAVIANGGKVLKVTATPERLDGSGLGLGHGGFATEMINGPCGRELIEMGRIMEPILLSMPADQLPDLTKAKKTAGDWSAADTDKAMEKKFVYRNSARLFQETVAQYGAGPAIAFCRSEEAALRSAGELSLKGFRNRVLTQKSAKTEADRNEILQFLDTGEIDIMVSVDIVSEGFDAPNLVYALSERPTESITVFLQQLGRILRWVDGKLQPVYIDCVGNCWRHRKLLMQEFYGDGYPWSLKGRQKGESNDADHEPKLTLKRCTNPECNYVSPGHAETCRCGWGFPAVFRTEPKKINGRLAVLKFDEIESTEEKRIREFATQLLKDRQGKSLAEYHQYVKLSRPELEPKKQSATAWAMHKNSTGR